MFKRHTNCKRNANAMCILDGNSTDIISHYKNSYHKMKFCLNIS
ncbi:hypothetical protein PT7_1015 [Pusillimonas sp. T7-7]|nr:hypothetical protein PT7_1015 [Pusillimonas sp. T7-7]